MSRRVQAEANRPKRRYVLFAIVPVGLIAFIAAHEVSVRHFQAAICTVCHEMQEPIRKWQEAGVSAHHPNCAGCHYDAGLGGWWAMNVSAIKFLVAHFGRDPATPIEPRKEPLFLEEGLEPGYWTRVPNHRCFQCHEAKNHAKDDQERVHEKALKNVLAKPCLDCHSHEMRKGQKFYEKVLPGQVAASSTAERSLTERSSTGGL